jgi:hypothetical protein
VRLKKEKNIGSDKKTGQISQALLALGASGTVVDDP